MFESVINDARRAVSSVIMSVLGRAVVAVPFIVAACFATAALTIALVERFGAQNAYWLLALGFALLGGIAGLIFVVAEQEEAVKPAPPPSTEISALSAAEQAIGPVTMLLPVLTSPFGFSATVGVAKWALRNVPLVVLGGLVGLLMWPMQRDGAEVVAEARSEDIDAALAAGKERLDGLDAAGGSVFTNGRDPGGQHVRPGVSP